PCPPPRCVPARGVFAEWEGRPDDAKRDLREAIDCARRQQVLSLELRAATSLARLRGGRQRDDVEARGGFSRRSREADARAWGKLEARPGALLGLSPPGSRAGERASRRPSSSSTAP